MATATIEVRSDPRIVWDLLADVPGWADWNPAIREISVDGDLDVGSHFRWAIGPGTRTSKLTLLEPPTRIAWRGSFMSIHHEQRWLIERRDDGCTVTAWTFLSRPLARLLRGRLERNERSDLEAWVGLLKLEAEDRAGT